MKFHFPQIASMLSKRGIISHRTKAGRKKRVEDKTQQDGSMVEKELECECKEEYNINPNIHLNNDVPDNVKDFIRSISKDCSSVKSNTATDSKLLKVTKPNQKKLSQFKQSPQDLVKPSRKASVQVIITTDFAPDNLSNVDYDRLKKVSIKKLVYEKVF